MLTKIGERLQCNVHSLAKDSAIVTAGHICNTLKGIVTGYLVSRLFPQEMYGAYRFALSIMGTLSFLAIPGFVSIVANQIAQRKKDAPVQSAVRMYTLWCAIVGIGMMSSIPLLHYWNREEMWPLILVAGILFVPTNLGTNVFAALIRGESRFDIGLRVSTYSNIVQVILVGLMLWLYPSALLLILCTTGVIGLFYTGRVLYWIRNYPSQESFRPFVQKAIALSLTSIPVTISWYIDGLLVSYYFGLKQLALLSVAFLIPEQVKIWTKEILTILYSRSAKGEDSAQKRKLITIAASIGILSFAIGIGLYWILTPFFIPMLFTQYDAKEVIFLTRIASISLLCAPATLFVQYLEARGKIREIQRCTWTSSFFFIIALFLFVPKFGALGAILARSTFRVCYAITGYYAFLQLPQSSEEGCDDGTQTYVVP